jgi:uncharacterized sporulation protein YeaH/YhbH (DUF444 family)
MSGFVIDRREQHRDKSTTSRDRFLRRYKDIIKKAAADTVKKAKGFRDITTGKDGQEHEIVIDNKSLDEIGFVHGKTGEHEFILGGNTEYVVGDLIRKPQNGSGNGNGSEGSPDGIDQDNFKFYLDREEFLKLILDDLALPDMIKKNLTYSLVSEYVHAGFTKDGSPGNMDVIRSYKQSLSRRIGLHRNSRKTRLSLLINRLNELLEMYPNIENAERTEENVDILKEISCLRDEIEKLKLKMKAMPYFDPNNDMRYRYRELERKPSVSAVMFCLMDVSGSMTENLKKNAKYFFMLLHLFLKKNYSNVDVVFVRHTTTAQEVDEETFFYDRGTGGTIVSSGLEKLYDIIKERYDPSIWNIYIAQASDGDNYSSDTKNCQMILEDKLLRLAQYMVYVEMSDESFNHFRQFGFGSNHTYKSDLWNAYENIANKNKNLKMKRIGDRTEIYSVFRELFEKKTENS